jgi:hypothetical protein
MHLKEFTLRRTKYGEVCVVPMTPSDYQVFVELRRGQRLDTNRVFLYKEKLFHRVGTALKAVCRRAGISNLRFQDFPYEDRRPQIGPHASAA